MQPLKLTHVFLVMLCNVLLLLGWFAFLHGSTELVFASSGDYFVKPGASGSCSQEQPCDLQTALNLAQNGDTVYVAQGIYIGSGDAVITVTKSITLAGGWDGISNGAIGRDATSYPSTLDGEGNRRVVYIGGNITPTIDGFTIANGNATGLSLSHCPSNADGCGGGVYISNAHPIIVNNTITNNVAAISTSGYSTGTTGYGGGLFLVNAENTIIRNNEIISNAGSTAYRGSGGGIFLWGAEHNGLQFQSNQVFSNSATTQDTIGYGGGIYGGPDNSLISDNIFKGNRTNQTGTWGDGAAIFQYSGNAHYLNNLLQDNYGGSIVQLQYSTAIFEANKILDNSTQTGIKAVNRAGNCSTPGCPILENNVVARSGSMGIYLGFASASQIFTSTLINNTFVGSNSGYGVYIDDYTRVFMTNTIIVSYTWGITTSDPISSSALADHTLFWVNTYDGILGDNPVNGNPVFSTDGYHLSSGSAAIDAGIDVGLSTDIDGNHRPVGAAVDIGADEFCIPIFLPLVLRN